MIGLKVLKNIFKIYKNNIYNYIKMPKAENSIEEGLTRQDTLLRESISINHNPDIHIQKNCCIKKCCLLVGTITVVTVGNIYISYLMYQNSNDGSGC